MKDKKYKLIIVGAGAAGLYAGAAAANFCRDVKADNCHIMDADRCCDIETYQLSDAAADKTDTHTDASVITGIKASDIIILEKMSSPGKKLLITGSGQCNLTHAGPVKDFPPHYNDAASKIRKLLYAHSNSEVMNTFERWGLPLMIRDDDKVFPKSMRARDVLDIMLAQINHTGIQLICNSECTGIHRDGEFWHITCGNHNYYTENLLITSGGASIPATGSDGALTKTLQDIGIEASSLSPALVKVYVQDYPFTELSGISFPKARVQITPSEDLSLSSSSEDLSPSRSSEDLSPSSSNDASAVKSTGKKRKQDHLIQTGAILLTHDALSGPCILDGSRGIFTGDSITINWISDGSISTDMLCGKLLEASSGSKARVLSVVNNALKNLNCDIPDRFIKLQLRRLERRLSQTRNCHAARTAAALETSMIEASLAAEIGKKMWQKIAAMFTEDTFSVSGKGGFGEAMCTRGGVSLEHIDMKAMQSRTHPGIYFAGEVLDVDADTGGYNLQFAFSSAMCAIRAIFGKYKKPSIKPHV